MLYFMEIKYNIKYLFKNKNYMANKQYYGIKYPFTANDNENYYVDVNKTMKDKVRSMLMHLVFTPKKQRIRQPDFGTDLIKYIFENNDATTWASVKAEIQRSVSKYITNININDVNVLVNDEDGHEIFVRIDYSVINGNSSVSDSIVAKI